MRISGKGKCKLIADCANFWQGKCKLIANFSATMVTSLTSLSVCISLSLSLSLSLSPKVPHAQYRKRFRASYNFRCNQATNSDSVCASVCVRVKGSLTLSTCLSNELALQQNVRQDRKFQAQRDLQCLWQMRGAVVNRVWCTRPSARQDSDYVMRKPSRCWLGAVPRYWNVVSSCFHFISFAEDTSAALAPGAGISQPILLLFFFVFLVLNSSTKLCLRFFYSVSKFSGVQKKTGLT